MLILITSSLLTDYLCRVLECIRDFMQELSKVRWMGRLLKKGSIEAALSDFHDLLDEAERTFQVSLF